MTSNPVTPEPDGRKKGPWANRVLSSEIEHTPEYDEFMKSLADYHEKRGTNLVREPELGRKLLDLHKLYKRVTEAGGYDKITETKGAWRDIANTYKPPVNNTNAGYLLKTIYYKYLAAYEILNFFGKDPPPKEWLEDRSAAGGAIMTRTAEDYQAQSPKPEVNGESASPPATEKRSLRHAPTPRQFYAPDNTPARQNPPRSASHPQQNNQGQLATNGENGTAHFPTFQISSTNAPIGRPVATPRNAPHEFQGRLPKQNGANGASNTSRFGAGHQGANFMQRIIMSLKSGMPVANDWALSQLVRISYEAGDELYVEQWPGLSEVLFERVRGVEALVNDSTKHGKLDNAAHAKVLTELEKMNEAALILRNLSMHSDNAKKFATSHYPKDIIVMCLRLPHHPYLVELKNYILDIVESMASSLPYTLGDPLFHDLAKGLNSEDRGILLGSLRAVCRLVMGRDDFNRVGDIPMHVVSRITSMLMLEDDELVSACLDFLYQYTTNEDNIQQLLRPPIGVELIRQLVRLLLFQGITGEQLVYIKTSRKQHQPIPPIPTLPQDIISDLLGYAEPERATKWMRCSFEEDADADITQIALWQAYQARFNEFTSTYPLLPAAEFIKNVSVAFTAASAMVLPTPQGQRFIIKGIRPRETPINTKGHIYIACKWHNSLGDPKSQCSTMVATPQDLWRHILSIHLAPTPTEASEQWPPLTCNWSGCSRFGPTGETVRMKLIVHVRTHMPGVHKPILLSREEQEMMEDPEGRVIIRRCQTQTDERGEAGGIPLTSILVLRNLKRRGGEQASKLLETCHDEFYEVMAVNKPLAAYVADLLLDG